jgi:hypothetical protein
MYEAAMPTLGLPTVSLRLSSLNALLKTDFADGGQEELIIIKKD